MCNRAWVCNGGGSLRRYFLLKWFLVLIALMMTYRACSLYSSLSSVVTLSNLDFYVSEKLSVFTIGKCMSDYLQIKIINSDIESFTVNHYLENLFSMPPLATGNYTFSSDVSASIITKLSSAKMKCDFQFFKKSSMHMMNSTGDSTLICCNAVSILNSKLLFISISIKAVWCLMSYSKSVQDGQYILNHSLLFQFVDHFSYPNAIERFPREQQQ